MTNTFEYRPDHQNNNVTFSYIMIIIHLHVDSPVRETDSDVMLWNRGCAIALAWFRHACCLLQNLYVWSITLSCYSCVYPALWLLDHRESPPAPPASPAPTYDLFLGLDPPACWGSGVVTSRVLSFPESPQPVCEREGEARGERSEGRGRTLSVSD